MATGNKEYRSVDDLPSSIPVFPLTGSLLLPRGQMPLNIFEPRYLQMVDAALSGDRMIGMVQPSVGNESETTAGLCRVGCAGRLVSFTETGDGRYLITLVGVSRFKIDMELETTTAFRQARVSWDPFVADLEEDLHADAVDRETLLKTFRSYLDANDMEADWNSVEAAKTEALVNALCMMSPYGPVEKQALLEAPDLKARADTLVAITEFSLVRDRNDGDAVLQ